MLRCLLLLYCCCTLPPLSAQKCPSDSLRAILSSPGASGEDRVSALYALNQCFDRSGSLDSSIHYALAAGRLAERLGLTDWRCKVYVKLGVQYVRTGKGEAADSIFRLTEPLCASDQNRRQFLNNRSVFYSMSGRLTEAGRDLLEALELARRLGDDDAQAMALINLSTNAYRLSDQEAALRYATQALVINERLGVPRDLSQNYSLLGTLHQQLGDKENALLYVGKAIDLLEGTDSENSLAYTYYVRGRLLADLRDYPAAIRALRTSVAMLEEMGDKNGLPTAKTELADQLTQTGQYEEAYSLAEESMDLTRKTKNYAALIQATVVRGRIRALRGNYRGAYADGEAAMAVSREQELFIDREVVYRLLILTDSLTANHERRAAHLREYLVLKDTLLSRAEAEKTAELRTRLATSEKEKALAVLAERTALQEQQATRQRRWIALVLVAAGLLAALVGYLLLQRRRLARTRRQLENSLLEKETLLREIHHRVKNNLQLVMSLLNLQADSGREHTVASFLEEGQHRVRAIALIHEQLYQSEHLSDINMRHYSRQLIERIRGVYAPSDIDFELAAEEVRLDIDQAVPVGIILNELLTNSLKYAFPDGSPGRIRVSLERAENSFELRVEDNGRGMAADANVSTSGLGLELIRLLVRQLRGTFSLTGQPGTRVVISFPQTA